MAGPCPFCKYQLNHKETNTPGDYDDYDCPNCGVFSLAGNFIRNVHDEWFGKSPKNSALLSHVIRKMQKGHHRVKITVDFAEEVLENQTLPSPMEQARNLVFWLGENLNAPGEEINLQPVTHQAIIGSMDSRGVKFVLDYLFEEDLIVGLQSDSLSSTGGAQATLSFNGWSYYEKLKRGFSESSKAFMAMPFKNTRLDQVYKECFKPAVKDTGFDLIRVDENAPAGLIDDRIRVEIRNSKFLISELTDENRGAYWEAGFAEGLGKPVIYTCEEQYNKKKGTHFDTNHHLTIFWNEDNLGEAAEKLKITIRATLPGEAKQEDDR